MIQGAGTLSYGEGWESWDCFVWKTEGSGSYQDVYIPDEASFKSKENSQIPLSDNQWQDKKKLHQLKYMEFQLNIINPPPTFYWEGDQTQE